MARVDIDVVLAYRCNHCEMIVLPYEAMYRDGPKMVIRHECPDGHFEDTFDESVALTRIQVS